MQYIYHYTSADVLNKLLEGIVEDHDSEKKSFVFHANSLFSMNDPTELVYGCELIWKELPKIEEQLKIDEEQFRLSKFWTFVNTEKNEQELNCQFIDALYENPSSPFVICFSRVCDSLPLWTMYGDNGYGVCLKFAQSVLQIEGKKYAPKVNILRNIGVVDVEYGKWGTDSILRKTLVDLYSNYYKDVKQLQSSQEIQQAKLDFLLLLCVVVATFLKNEAYEYEKESRLLCYETNDDRIFYDTNRIGQLISYKKIKISTEYLKEIIVGPCADFKSTERILKQLTRKYGLEGVHISASKVPYRD